LAAIWVSFLPRNAEMTRKALAYARESRVVALKTTFLLGGNPDPSTWDEETQKLADECFDVCEQHDLVFHFHTSPGGNSDITKFIPLVEMYGKRCKIYLVHFGGGVSGHIRLVPKFLQWAQEGYKVYTDTSWAVGFGARWLLTEIEKTGVGGAGPSDAGFIWVRGLPLTVPMHAAYARHSPYTLRVRERGAKLFYRGEEVGPVAIPPRPRIYDLRTADGIPYWKIALLHLDSI